MNSIVLSKAEAIILHDILQNMHVELSPMIGQDMTASLEDSDSAKVVAEAAAEFNYEDVEVIDSEGNYNLFSGINHFLYRLESGQEE